MKTRDILMKFLLGVVMMSSCSGDENSVNSSTENAESIPVRFSSYIVNGVKTKTSRSEDLSSTLWNKDDEIGIYMMPTEPDHTIYFVENNPYKATDEGKSTNFEAKIKEIYFPRKQSHKVNFLAYYPYNENIKDFIYNLDIRNQQDPSKIDLLYCRVDGKSRSSEAIELKFDHILSHFILKVELEEGLVKPRLENVAIRIYKMNTRASFDLSTGFLNVEEVLPSDIANHTIYPQITEDGCNVLFFPQEGAPLFQFNITTDAVQQTFFEWKMKKTKFEAGKQYIYTLTIGINGIKVRGEVNDWIPSQIGAENIQIN